MLITCSYEGPGHDMVQMIGANVDYRRMEATFHHLNYHPSCTLQNKTATKENILRQVSSMSEYLNKYDGPTEGKTVVFAFSGHGTTKNEREKIYDNNGKMLDLLDDIVRHLVKPMASKAAKIPILFFIDACRGGQRLVEDDGKYVQGLTSCGAGEKSDPTAELEEHYFDHIVDEVYGNYRIDYCTIPYYVSYSMDDGSIWMPKLADKMIEKYDSFQNIAAIVRRNVFKHPVLEKNTKKQQCESVGSLWTGPLCLTRPV